MPGAKFDDVHFDLSMGGVALLLHGSSNFLAGAGFDDINFELSMAGVALFDMYLQLSCQAQDLVTWTLIFQ